MMMCKITKITTIEDAHAAIEATMFAGFVAKANLNDIYSWEHSVSRTQMFWICLYGIPRGVSDHLVRHAAVGQQHFVKSSLTNRGGAGWENTSLTDPTDHRMLLNAQHLIDMAKLRLCYKANEKTREIMNLIREELMLVDWDLARFMVPKCVYRGGICSEPKPCGNYKITRYDPDAIKKRMQRREV